MKIVPFEQLKRMTHSRHFFILAISIMILLGMGVSCKDKKPSGSSCTDPNFCQSVLAAKDFFVFKIGSWWVYEEETSHERDSMYVTQSVNSTSDYHFDVRIKSALTDYEYRYWPEYYGTNNGCSPTGPVTKRCLLVRREKGKFQDNLGESFVFFVRYFEGDFIYSGANPLVCPNNTVSIGKIYDNYTVSAETFGRTVRIDELCDYAEGRQPTKFYYSKNIGIIRKELIDSNQVWNLVNYHIEP
jgi:hypothetical protein